MSYWRPVVQVGPSRPREALTLAGGWGWFTHVELLERDAPPRIKPVAVLPETVARRLTAPRPPIAGLSMNAPRIMAILNVTPDSFSDGGRHDDGTALRLVAEGADIVDIGGESTRPGATEVPVQDEIARIRPAIAALRSAWDGAISIDTRKAGVARAAVDAGATLLNDVSALTWDPAMAAVAADSGLPLCLMHAQGDPQTMQDAPAYADVLLDVYDHLSDRIEAAESAGIARKRIVIDPGIGFSKTLEHNLALLARISLFHALGCPILLGASRKRFIGTIGGADTPGDRLPGSVAVALAGIAQGVQIVRVHDMAATRQALRLWQAATSGERP